MIRFGDLSKVSTRTRLLAALMGAVMLASCGGGEQEETFQPDRIVTFGDENTLILPTGYQYTVNNPTAATSTTAAVPPCANSPIWVEYVAATYNLNFAECSGVTARANARMLATLGATIPTVNTAVNDFKTSTGFNSKDLVTLMVGTHDLMALYESYTDPAASQAALVSASESLGEDLGQVVLNVTSTGAKVLITTVPNIGTSVWGLTQTESNRNTLAAMVTAFNDGLNAKISEIANGGGRNGAVLEVDQEIEKYRRDYNSAYSTFTEKTKAACVTTAGVTMADADLTSCLYSDDLDNNYYLWAGRVQFGLLTHATLGSVAVTRIRANPL